MVVDYLPEEMLIEVRNLGEFAGMLALDKWTGNANGRQAVFSKKSRERRYLATFIDQGYCFNAGEWKFVDAPLRGVYARNAVYRDVAGWESFEPWLARIERWRRRRLGDRRERCRRSGTAAISRSWNGWSNSCLTARPGAGADRGCFGNADRGPFPKWMERGKKSAAGEFADAAMGREWGEQVGDVSSRATKPAA